jgi:hypothetical protein
MKKAVLLSIFLFAVLPFAASAGNNPVILKQVDYSEYFYGNTFDNLVLDFKVMLGSADTLNTLTVENIGNARDGMEVNKLKLWLDDGNGKFDGFEKDTELGTSSSYENSTNNWIFSNLNAKLKAIENRLFVSVETLNKGTAGRYFSFALPAAYDANNNKAYDSGDRGMFFTWESVLAPTKLSNDDTAKYKIVTGDPWKPVVVMTNLINKQTIDGSSFTIKGKAKDQGGSFPDVIQVCIDAVCKTATGTENWEYAWTNIVAGDHTVYATAKDFSGNIGQAESIVVNVKKSVAIFSKEKSVVALDKTLVSADGVDPLVINVTIKNSDNEATANKIVFLNEITDKSGAVVVKSKTTDSLGQVSFKARSTEPGIKTLSITTEDGDTVKDKFTVEYVKVLEDIDYTSGRWIKLADQTAVYFLDKNNMRHAYPTSAVWESYFGKDFSKVEEVSGVEMASFSLGRNVPFKAGILMKIPSVNKVYYVSQNAKISWVMTADLAKSMYGADWTKKVKDLPEAFFTDYFAGKNIE